MSPSRQKLNPLVERFQADLAELEPRDVIRKHITTGMPAKLASDDYFALRNLVADEFELHPSAVILVGSCRTGFSIAPKKRYKMARPDSDLDLAIVSLERFDTYWDSVFEFAQSDSAWKHSSEYSRFVAKLFRGWIDPRGLPNVPRFKQAVKWTSFFDKLMRSRQFGRRRISARLYRTWSRLEAYQKVAVLKCIAVRGDDSGA